jgi:hypothetical protein
VERIGDKVTIVRTLRLNGARHEAVAWPELRALLLARPLTFGSRIHPGKMYKGVVDVAERFAEVINAELKGLVAAGADVIVTIDACMDGT